MKVNIFAFGLLVALSLLPVIYWIYLITNRKQYHPPGAICVLVRNENLFNSCINSITYNHLLPNDKGMFTCPKELRKLRIRNIQRENDLVFFDYRSDWIDDAYQVLVYDLKKRPGNELILYLINKNLKRRTFHIQIIHQVEAHHWYYWEYDD